MPVSQKLRLKVFLNTAETSQAARHLFCTWIAWKTCVFATNESNLSVLTRNNTI